MGTIYLSKIVREMCYFNDMQDPEDIQRWIKETKAVALKAAETINIVNPEVTELYDICPLSPLDYPMHLLGEGAPQINNYQDALCHGFGRGKYIVIVREKEKKK